MFLSVTMGRFPHEVLRMSAAEISFLACYYRMEPWGPPRDDVRIGKQTADLALIHGVKKEGGEHFTFKDFTLKFGDSESDEPTDDGSTAMRGLFKKASK